ncbi:MAG: hypothetical protein QM698_14270 [Micropepsaceae bacterium]
MKKFWISLAAATALAGASFAAELLNVSYDPTRELYKQVNEVFAAKWKAETGEDSEDQPEPRRFGQAGAVGDRRA